jgi:6-pyruvoyltetrahydropterin/6-carboxytetrahydropterin synthase
MVCDFKAIKETLQDFLDTWDHALCLNTADPSFAFLEKTYGTRVIPFAGCDPTSEVMARTIFTELQRRLASFAHPRIAPGVRLERVRVTETSSSWAEYSEP